jgi:hypothetical protein
MNDFYEQPKILVWIESILLLLVGLFLALLIIDKGYSHPVIYSAFILYIPISQFLFTPFFKLTGGYTYYSPMLLGYMANHQQIDLHSGTSFDHLFVLRNYKPGIKLRNRLLIYHLEGLLQLITLIENKSIPQSVNIVGTSYFFNDRTLNKLGFQIEKASLFYRINLFINFIDLCWMYSFSRGTFSIPNVWHVKKASIQGVNLIAQKKKLEGLRDKLKAKQLI